MGFDAGGIGHPWKLVSSGDGGFGDVGEDVIELDQGLTGLGVWWRKQRVVLVLSEGSSEIFGGGEKDVGGAGSGHGKVVWEPADCVGDADGIGGRDPDVVAAVVMKAGADVVAASGVNGESLSAFGTFMGVDLDAGWSEWRLVEIVRTVNLCMGGQLRINSGRTEQIECESGLWEKLVPEIEGEGGVSAAEARDEVVFERLDGAFSPVATMEASRS